MSSTSGTARTTSTSANTDTPPLSRMKSALSATFLSGSTNDSIRLNQRATKPPLLLVTDKLLQVAHQLPVLLGPDGQLLQPGDVLLEALAALLWDALLVPPACIIRHIEQWWRKVEVIIQEILNGQFRCCVGKEEKGNKAEGMHDKRHWSRVPPCMHYP